MQVKTPVPPDDGPAGQPADQTVTHSAMGTVMTHMAFGPPAASCLAAICREVARLEGLLSRFLFDSEVGRVNRAAEMGCERVSLDTYEVLSKAIEFSHCLPGCFDVTIGPLVRLWQAPREASAEPEPGSIKQALPLVNCQDLILDPSELTAALRYAGQSVDLGGIGKGYAGDQIVDVFKRYGVSSAFSNLGGNVVTWGARPDGSPWRIGIQHPRQENRVIGFVSVVGEAVVTSGDYQRCFIDSSGKRRHHILDPCTGYPSESGLISVSIIAHSAILADALSTAVFVAGLENGPDLLSKYGGADAILVDQDLVVHVTQGLKDRFQADASMTVKVLG